MSLNKLFLFFALLIFSLTYSAWAQLVGHNNNLELSRIDSKNIQCVLSVNLLQLLHQVLSPQSSYADFLQSFAELSDADMDKALDKLTKALTAKSFLTLPEGAQLSFKLWQLPSKQLIRDAIKVSLVMVHMPPNAASHLDPMLVQARFTGKLPISRVQLQLHPALLPVFVTNKDDKFWLTREIPMAILDIN